MKTTSKLLVIVTALALLLLMGYQTEQGKILLGKLASSTMDIQSMMEKEKVKHINEVIALNSPVYVDGYQLTLADLLAQDILVLPYCKSSVCDDLIRQVSAQSNTRFIVLGFSGDQPTAPLHTTNDELIFATTPLDQASLKMDSLLSPVIYHLNVEGRIVNKEVGFNPQDFPRLLQGFRG